MEKKGSLFGAALLIAGCCIGAGMLGLPVLSALAGFEPSVLMFAVSWLFMTCTGLLLLEVNLWFRDEVNIVSMAGRTLGTVGKVVAWGVFLFLFYCLMVAYVSGSGELFADFYEELVGTKVPNWVGSVVMIAIFGMMVYLGTGAVDHFNRVLMAGLAVSYILLVYFGLPHVNTEYLKHRDWSVSAFVIPAMIVSFGFHNLVPSITNYLGGDSRRLRLAIIFGSLVPLVIYIVWEWLILGLVPIDGPGGFREALGQGDMATRALKSAVGGSWIVDLAHYFAFFAIVTSFLGVALSFVDFLSDGLKIKKTPSGKVLLCALVLLPPLVFSIIYPKIFLVALNYAGGFGAVILFGILPALMVWYGRYRKHLGNAKTQIVPGGKPMLVAVIIFSLAIVALQLAQELK